MVITEMNKPLLKVSVSDSDCSSDVESEVSDIENGDKLEGIEADAESAVSSDENEHKNDGLITNEGWADSIAKILGSSKPKNKKTLVLSRAKKYSDVVKKEKEEKPSFEVIGDTKEDKPVVKIEEDITVTEPPPKKKKHDKPSIRLKPNILEKDRERLLAKIATKGVVQLFNAVRNQQKTLDTEMSRSDLSEVKKDRLLKKFDKRAFLDTLMGQTKSINVDEQTKALKNEVKEEDNDQPRWNALRDDFMTGAKMKDWDKESDDE